ncbi:MAG: extracellular solute-binding protein [Bacilli bacterium]
MMKNGQRAALAAGLAMALGTGLVGGGAASAATSNGPIKMTLIGFAGWAPSSIAAQMAETQFPAYAKKHWGLNVQVSYATSPFADLYSKPAASLAAHSPEYDLIWGKGMWYGAFASPGWIEKMNKVVASSPELKKAEANLISPAIRWSYQTYPYKSNNLWGFPSEGDALILYVRKDMLNNPANQAAFKKKFGWALPTRFSQWQHLTWGKYVEILKFFNDPSKGFYGLASEYSQTYDFMFNQAMTLVRDYGGRIWNRSTRQVYGVLNSPQSNAGLRFYVSLLKYQPPGANTWGITHDIEAFTQGKVFSTFMWSAVGPAIFTPQMKGKVMAVPVPGRIVNKKFLQYSAVGGQSWLINHFIGPRHKAAAYDLIKWWYLPSTQMEFAMRGGNAVIKSVVDSPAVQAHDPWYRAYAYTMTTQHLVDEYHNVDYASLMSEIQKAWSAYATGEVSSASVANTYAAYRQQNTLYNTGLSNHPAPSAGARAKL